MQPTRVLFLCIGNSCRSPMAEGFARAYGGDVLVAQSAGLAPAISVAPLTRKVMAEKNIDLGDYYPQDLGRSVPDIELIINMSGHRFPLATPVRVEDWEVRDPIGESEDVYRQVRDDIEKRVLQLIEVLRLRRPPAAESKDTAPVDTRRRPPRQ